MASSRIMRARWVLFTLILGGELFCGAAGAGSSDVLERFLAGAGLTRTLAAQTSTQAVELAEAHQDWKHLTADRSCHTLTPIKIGNKAYAKGLGAHARGLASFRLQGPFVRFLAEVGIDNNPDTGGTRGSVEFVVKVDGVEAAHTPVCRGGETARPLEVRLQNARRLELVVTDGGDGYSYDQADWAEARLVDEAGRITYLSDVLRARESHPFLRQTRLPASFIYGGEPSGKLLSVWPRDEKPPLEQRGRVTHEVTWREPGRGLVVTWRAEVFSDSPAMEFRWTFRNQGDRPARILSQVHALDLEADLAPSEGQLVRSSGGLTGGLQAADLGFAVSEARLGRATLSGAGGRSSNRDLPFFLVQGDPGDGGIFLGMGWSGQWQADLGSSEPTGKLRLTAGMPGMNLALPPGETLLTPSILLGLYRGDATTGGNALRRLLYSHYVPLLEGRKPLAPVSWNSWFRFENSISEAKLKGWADLAAGLGLEYFCIDAGWFDGDFPNGVGNWTINRAKFPNGLRPIGEHVRARGMKLGLWFEPERVAAGTRLGREHPEWVCNDLLNLGQPDAREWIFRMMRQHIDEGGVRWIRFDFNTEPLPTWERMDSPETRGLAQARHIAGLYDLLDRLRTAYPDLLLEGCASGGRRIDLETIKRSHTFWKSDETGSLPVLRFHETGGNRFLPAGLLNANLLQFNAEADVHSLFGGPLGFGLDWGAISTPRREALAKLVEAYKSLRPWLNADYYPLFAQRREETEWVGWQFHDPATDEGFCLVLRPGASPYSAAVARLRGLKPDRDYVVAPLTSAAGPTIRLTGARLVEGWEVRLPQPGSSQVFTCRPVTR